MLMHKMYKIQVLFGFMIYIVSVFITAGTVLYLFATPINWPVIIVIPAIMFVIEISLRKDETMTLESLDRQSDRQLKDLNTKVDFLIKNLDEYKKVG